VRHDLGEWVDLYAFNRTPHYAVDNEMYNHFTSTHPTKSLFTSSMLVARTARTATASSSIAACASGGAPRSRSATSGPTRKSSRFCGKSSRWSLLRQPGFPCNPAATEFSYSQPRQSQRRGP
jgi:hypothetical protein